MKLSKSRCDTTKLLSTKTKECLARTLPSSLRGVVDDTFLNSFVMAFEMGSFNVILFFINFVVKTVDVTTPMTLPDSSLTGN
jgi:hypothetical protein